METIFVSRTEQEILEKFWNLYTQECQNSPVQYQMQLETEMDKILTELSIETRIRFIELLDEYEEGGRGFAVHIALEDAR